MKKVVIKGVLIAALLFTSLTSVQAESYYQFDNNAFVTTQESEIESDKSESDKEESSRSAEDTMANTDTVTLQYPDTVLEKRTTVTKNKVVQHFEKLPRAIRALLAGVTFVICICGAVVLRRFIEQRGKNK